MRIRPLVTAFVCAATAAGFTVTGASGATASTTWSSTATKAISLVKATRLGTTPATKTLTVRVAMDLRNEGTLKSLIVNAGNPSSSQYGKFLTPAEFVSEFAPTEARVKAVETYLKNHGFSSVSVSANHLLVSGKATAGDVEKAFDTKLSDFRQAGAEIYANTTAAKVPASLKGVGSVLGLNDIVGFKAPLAHKSGVKAAASKASSTGVPQYDVSYMPDQFPSIYGATSSTPTGSKTSIAIIAEGNLTQVVKDLRLAETKSRIYEPPVTIEHTGIASSDTSGADEWDMDTQVSTAMAGRVKRLYLYDATSLTDSDLALSFSRFASDDKAQAGSASLGECETLPYLDGSMLADDESFAEAAAQGQSFFASSGDTGISCAVAGTNGVPDSGPPDVNYPASSPYVTAVGGTSLFTNSDNSYDEEIAWNSGGGGTSVWETAPQWQSTVVPGSDLGKGVPDIAMDADPYSGVTLYIDGAEEEGYGGTSLSSPLSLGVWARLESGHSNKLGMASPALYRTYLAGSCTDVELTDVCSTSAFHDITVGTNGGYVATPGWDYTTGLGTFEIEDMEQLVK